MMGILSNLKIKRKKRMAMENAYKTIKEREYRKQLAKNVRSRAISDARRDAKSWGKTSGGSSWKSKANTALKTMDRIDRGMTKGLSGTRKKKKSNNLFQF